MSKILLNTSGFNVTCNKCGGLNITCEQKYNTVFMTCSDCKKKDFEDKYGKVPELIQEVIDLNSEAMDKIVDDSKTVKKLLEELKTILSENFKDEVNSSSCWQLKKNSSNELVSKVKDISKKLQGLYVIEKYHERSKHDISITVRLFGEMILDDNTYKIVTTDYYLQFYNNELSFIYGTSISPPISISNAPQYYLSGQLEYILNRSDEKINNIDAFFKKMKS